jgi:EF-P lysine aminoacylase GenX
MSRLETLRRLGIPLYPARSRRTHTIGQLHNGLESSRVVIAGRLEEIDVPNHRGILHDVTGSLPIRLASEINAFTLTLWPHLVNGDLVECLGKPEQGALVVSEITLLTPSLRSCPETMPPGMLNLRADFMRLTRRFFDERGFMAADTPTFMATPDLTSALKSFQTPYHDAAGRSHPFYLQTSPEHYMKRLLVCGFEKIYQICRFYRNGERYDHHHPEFTGLEWYQAFADYTHIMKTTEQYVAFMAIALRGDTTIVYQGRAIDLSPPWPRNTVRAVFLEHTGIDLNECASTALFRDQARRAGFDTAPDDTWDDIFHRLFMKRVEPALPADRPVFLIEYPAQLPSLARHVPDNTGYVERFELYIGGLELANAFTELNDPVEQRRRFEADCSIKREMEGYEGGVDEALLAALEYGMPPSGGVAVGLDRLIMLFADVPTIDPVIVFRNM